MKHTIYRALSLANDIESARTPASFIKRQVRKLVYRKVFGLLRRLFHAVGLM